MKDFDTWSRVKKAKEGSGRLFYKERDIWWMSFGLNIGDEEGGKGQTFSRPVLIIKKFNNHIFWGCAVSSRIKEENKYYVPIKVKDKIGSVILSQFRLYDSKRLGNKIVVCDLDDFLKIKQAIKGLL